ncbi:MAG: T9SS type A sorting domain-containing protein [Candidatus Pacearchaeota archaeon]|nr:MAG: T9SS type A sorting domain-containing protein [Candidatus Pacearchaeota archaeon]
MGLKSTLLTLFLAGVTFLLPKLADALPNFDGWAYPDSANVTFFKPNSLDSAKTMVGQIVPNYWVKTVPDAWGVSPGDSGLVRFDAPSDTSYLKWFCRGNFTLQPTAFVGGYGISVRDVTDGGIDSVDAKCFKQDGLDTLYGRFDITSSSWAYEIYFDASTLGLVDEDTVVIEAAAPGKYGITKGEVQHRFLDADTLASFNLDTVSIKENLEKKVKVDKLNVRPNPANEFFYLNQSGKINIYNMIGSQVKEVKGNKVYTGDLPQGHYFVKFKPEDSEKTIMKSIKIIH